MDEPENTSESTVLLNTKEDKGVPKTARARKVSPSSKAKDSIPGTKVLTNSFCSICFFLQLTFILDRKTRQNSLQSNSGPMLSILELAFLARRAIW